VREDQQGGEEKRSRERIHRKTGSREDEERRGGFEKGVATMGAASLSLVRAHPRNLPRLPDFL